MSVRGQKKSKGVAKTPTRSLSIAQRGIHTGADFAQFMSALMSDIIEERIDPGIANAACNAGGKLLKVVEMQYRYGEKTDGTAKRVLTLAPLSPVADAVSKTVQ